VRILTYIDVQYSKTECPQPCSLSNRSHQDIGRDDSQTHHESTNHYQPRGTSTAARAGPSHVAQEIDEPVRACVSLLTANLQPLRTVGALVGALHQMHRKRKLQRSRPAAEMEDVRHAASSCGIRSHVVGSALQVDDTEIKRIYGILYNTLPAS
jgi:hypothetical protein